MYLIPDDPIVRSIERTGYPSWFGYHYDNDEYSDEEESEEKEEDEYFED